MTTTPLGYIVQLIGDFVDEMKDWTLEPIGLPNWSIFTFFVIALVGGFTITLLGGDDDD